MKRALIFSLLLCSGCTDRILLARDPPQERSSIIKIYPDRDISVSWDINRDIPVNSEHWRLVSDQDTSTYVFTKSKNKKELFGFSSIPKNLGSGTVYVSLLLKCKWGSPEDDPRIELNLYMGGWKRATVISNILDPYQRFREYSFCFCGIDLTCTDNISIAIISAPDQDYIGQSLFFLSDVKAEVHY